jgi:hypothetical protein
LLDVANIIASCHQIYMKRITRRSVANRAQGQANAPGPEPVCHRRKHSYYRFQGLKPEIQGNSIKSSYTENTSWTKIMFPKSHTCPESNLYCFDCQAKICRDCMTVTPKSMLCKKCGKGATVKVAKANLAQSLSGKTAFQAASVFYSFIAFAVLSVFAGCVGWIGSTSLVAALLGVGVVEKLNQVKVSLTKGSKMPLLIIGIILGGTLGFGFRFLFTAGGGMQYFALIPFGIGILLMIAAAAFRLRSTWVIAGKAPSDSFDNPVLHPIFQRIAQQLAPQIPVSPEDLRAKICIVGYKYAL